MGQPAKTFPSFSSTPSLSSHHICNATKIGELLLQGTISPVIQIYHLMPSKIYDGEIKLSKHLWCLLLSQCLGPYSSVLSSTLTDISSLGIQVGWSSCFTCTEHLPYLSSFVCNAQTLPLSYSCKHKISSSVYLFFTLNIHVHTSR